MATIKKEFTLEADADRVWDALRDFGALDSRLVPGFVTACECEGDVRVVTFSNGSTAHEYLVSRSDSERRLVYGIANERLRHYSAAAEVFPDDETCRFVWTVDVLPNEAASYIEGQMELGVAAMKAAFAA